LVRALKSKGADHTRTTQANKNIGSVYVEQGNVDTKALLGHRDDRTAAMYGDSRGAEWVTVKVG